MLARDYMVGMRTIPSAGAPGSTRAKRGRIAARVLWIAIAAVIVSGVVGGISRGLKDRPNWGSLRRESTHVWEHRESADGTAMFGYLPTAVFALWPFMVWPPQPLGLILYVAANVLAAAGSVWIVRRYWLPPPGPDWTFAIPVFLISANFQHAIQSNQLTLWTLLLCVAGLTLVHRARPLSGGLLLGLAGLIKVMPFLLAGYLVLRRKWAALAGIAAAVLLFDLVPCVLFFGWDGTVNEHAAWLQRTRWHSNTVQIEDPMRIGVFRHTSNFSYSSVLARWLRGLPDAEVAVVLAGNPPAGVAAGCEADLKPGEVLVRSPMPPRSKPWNVSREAIDDIPRLNIARLPARTVWWIWAGTLAVGLGALALATWMSGRRGGEVDWPAAAAVWLLAVFFVTPMMRHYYLALAFPALAVVWRTLVVERTRGGRLFEGGRILPAAGLVAWLVGVACLGWDHGRWYGLHLAVLVVLSAAAVRSWRRIALRSARSAECTDEQSPREYDGR